MQNASRATDGELVSRLSTDRGAIAELWRRHGSAGIAAARALAPEIDPEDLVQESFTRIIESVARGAGPQHNFRPYLYQVIRNLVHTPKDDEQEVEWDLETLPEAASMDPALADDFDSTAVRSAFQSLSPRSQEVLWYSQVEGLRPRQFANFIGTSPGNAAVLVFRAKEELRIAWVGAHVDERAQSQECRVTIGNLMRFYRGTLTSTTAQRVETHLAACAHCSDAAAESKRLITVPRVALLASVLGIPLSTALGTANAPGAAAFGGASAPGGCSAKLGSSGTAPGPGAWGLSGGASMSPGIVAGSLIAASTAAVLAAALLTPAISTASAQTASNASSEVSASAERDGAVARSRAAPRGRSSDRSNGALPSVSPERSTDGEASRVSPRNGAAAPVWLPRPIQIPKIATNPRISPRPTFPDRSAPERPPSRPVPTDPSVPPSRPDPSVPGPGPSDPSPANPDPVVPGPTGPTPLPVDPTEPTYPAEPKDPDPPIQPAQPLIVDQTRTITVGNGPLFRLSGAPGASFRLEPLDADNPVVFSGTLDEHGSAIVRCDPAVPFGQTDYRYGYVVGDRFFAAPETLSVIRVLLTDQ